MLSIIDKGIASSSITKTHAIKSAIKGTDIKLNCETIQLRKDDNLNYNQSVYENKN